MRLRMVAAMAFVLAGLQPACAAGKVTVFAAASLTDAIRTIDHDYGRKTGVTVKAAFASSAALARQVEAGAPAQIFASADTRWMQALSRKGLVDDSSKTLLLGNALVLVAPADTRIEPLAIGPHTDWRKLLGPEGRLAIGDPDAVPAGIYARQALTYLGAWSAVAPRLIRAENVRAALAYVERGETALGIVYATDARIAKVKVIARFPASSHAPIVYPFAILKGAHSPAVDAYYRYLTGPAGRDVFRRFGFTIS